MKVMDPSGVTWSVSRRWLPWRRRWRLRDAHIPAGSGPGDGGSDVLGLVLVVLTLVAVVPAVLLALVVALELLLLLALLPLVLLGRVVLRRDWCVEVSRRDEPWTDEPAGDWRDSQLRIHELAADIARGQPPGRTVPDR